MSPRRSTSGTTASSSCASRRDAARARASAEGPSWKELEEDIFSEEFLLTRPAARGDPCRPTRWSCWSTRWTGSSSRPRRCCSRSCPSTRSPSPSSGRCGPPGSPWSSSPPTTPASSPRRSSGAACTCTSTTPTSSASGRSCAPGCPGSPRSWPTRWRASCARCAPWSCKAPVGLRDPRLGAHPGHPRRRDHRRRRGAGTRLHILLKYQTDIERAAKELLSAG